MGSDVGSPVLSATASPLGPCVMEGWGVSTSKSRDVLLLKHSPAVSENNVSPAAGCLRKRHLRVLQQSHESWQQGGLFFLPREASLPYSNIHCLATTPK